MRMRKEYEIKILRIVILNSKAFNKNEAVLKKVKGCKK
jgi:hypothetical protein